MAKRKRDRPIGDEELLEMFEDDPVVQELWDLGRRLEIIDMAVSDPPELGDAMAAVKAEDLEGLTPRQLFGWTMGQVMQGMEQLREVRKRECLADYRTEEKAEAGDGDAPALPPPPSGA